MPNTPLNKEELRYKVQEIIQSFHDPLDNGSGHHSIVYAAKEIVSLMEVDRDAAVREARIDERNRVSYEHESFSNELMKDRVLDVKHWWLETAAEAHEHRLAELQSQPNAKEE